MKALRVAAAAVALAVCAPAAADDPRLVTVLTADAMFGETLLVRFEPGAPEPIEIVATGVRPCGPDLHDCPSSTFRWSSDLPGAFVDAGEVVAFDGVMENDEGTRCGMEFYGVQQIVDSESVGAAVGAETSVSADRRGRGYVSGNGYSIAGYYLAEAGLATYPCYCGMYSGDERYNGTFVTELSL